MSFSIQKKQLAEIITANQNRTFDEEIEMLQSKAATNEWLASGLNSSLTKGIFADPEDINERLQFYGTNKKPVKEPPGFFQLVCEALQDFTLRILIVAALITIAIEVGTAEPEKRGTAWIEGFAILIAVFISVTVTAFNDYQKERQFIKLNKEKEKSKMMTVIRRGTKEEVHQDDMLVGDLVKVTGGMEVPADGYLLEANEVVTDESAMTGQTKPIKKNTLQRCIKKRDDIVHKNMKNESHSHTIPSPIMLSGTNVITGEGLMMIMVVGEDSCIGVIRSKLAQDEDGPTPLQNKLQKIAEDIGKFGLYSAIVILVVLLIRFGVQKGISQEWDNTKDFAELLHYFLLALTVVVVAIPEGLPLAVTLSLAFSVNQMLNDNNLVRKLQACETMGGANNICSDKTGTLTKNEMTVTHYWNESQKTFPAHEQSIKIEDHFNDENFSNLYVLSSAINGTAELQPPKGSATELAILKLLRKMGYNYDKLRGQKKIPHLIPFNSERKRMSTVVEEDGKKIMLLKGASEIVLSACNKWMVASTGEVKEINGEILQEMKQSIVTMAKKSLRTLCFAYKHISDSEDFSTSDDKGVYEAEKSGFTLLIIIGVKDIPRDQVPKAIQDCKKAGITVRMVTGDNLITAKAISEEIGLIDPNDDKVIIMQGKDFIQKVGGVVCKKCQTQKCDCPINMKDAESKKMDPDSIRVDTIKNGEEFDKICDNLLVLARSRPEDKYALVTGLKERGNVVAVTGDGTNDAPALKKADVGFAMGQAGTEVAKEAAAIILIKDDFDSIVKAVLWGRNIYDSIRKFLQFQLTVNIVAVLTTLIGAALIKQEILKPIQMLWVNLIMDTLASLALATEPPTPKLLDRLPHKRDDYIVSKTMFKHIIGQAIFQVAILVILLFIGQYVIPEYADDFDNTDGFERNYKYTDTGMARSGRYIFIDGTEDYQPIYEATDVNSRHLTFIFNTFVMMQIFNFINSRKIHDEMNVFDNITVNLLFPAIVLIILVMQIILVTFAGFAFGVYSYFGLHPAHWGISIAIGAISLLVNILLKLMPTCNCFPEQGKDEGNFANPESKIAQLRRRKSSVLRDISHHHIE